MLKRVSPWLWILGIAVLSRLLSMALFPLVDTTEPRYAEIARVMAETNDWTTPWFEPGVPFWGKPPLSFWLQALSIDLFGLSEFSVRLPAWLANLGLIALIWRFARELYGDQAARWSAVVFATMSLSFISAGAVMTDPFLVLGTTLSLVSFGMISLGRPANWRWLFFVGLVIGLLAKGPLAAVLTGLPMGLWLLFDRKRFSLLRELPWIRGTLLTAILVLPWYIAAELKTPGFLDYFIIGEHFRRFLDPGWAGDLYGVAHVRPKGMVWLFWIWASFPWGILALLLLVVHGVRHRQTLRRGTLIPGANMQLLLLCALAPMLFFSLAGNTLWTYVLPSLPFSAIVIARGILALELTPVRFRRVMVPVALLVPLLITGYLPFAVADASGLKTERSLASQYDKLHSQGDSELFYLNDLPFSAEFYSEGTASRISMEDLTRMRQNHRYNRYFVAVPKREKSALISKLPQSTEVHLSNKRFVLLSFSDSDEATRG